jgi:hypothetical protein
MGHGLTMAMLVITRGYRKPRVSREMAMGYTMDIPGLGSTYKKLLKMAIEIVDLPIKKVIFHSYVSLPEGTP